MGSSAAQARSPKPNKDRARFCEQVNYSKSFAVARRMCAAAQHSQTETMELMKVLAKFEKDMHRRQKQREGDGKEQEFLSEGPSTAGEGKVVQSDMEVIDSLLECDMEEDRVRRRA